MTIKMAVFAFDLVFMAFPPYTPYFLFSLFISHAISWMITKICKALIMAMAALIAGIITLLKPGTDTTQITGLILSLGSVVAYIVGEGLVDAAAAGTTVNITGNPTITGVEDTATAEADKAAQKAISGTVQADGGKSAA